MYPSGTGAALLYGDVEITKGIIMGMLSITISPPFLLPLFTQSVDQNEFCTGLKDYRDALTPGAVVLKVHRSNFDVVGFTEEAGLAELAELCRPGGHVLIYDAGSGALFPFGEVSRRLWLSRLLLSHEPSVDWHRDAGDEGRLVRAQVDDRVRDLLGLAEPPHGLHRGHRVEAFLCAAAEALDHGGVNDAGAD